MVQGLASRLLRPRATTAVGRALFAAVSAQARNPVLYREGGVPDTVEGRFELCAAHVVLVLRRLKGQGSQASETAQALFDAFLNNLDEGLRDMGVGDLSVGKKMRKLGEAIYGRVRGYDAALDEQGRPAALAALIGRTMFGDAGSTQAGPIARYVCAAADGLEAQALAEVLEGRVGWPAFVPGAPHEP